MKTTKEKNNYIGFKLKPELAERLRKHVSETCGNMSWLMDKILTEYLDKVDKGE